MKKSIIILTFLLITMNSFTKTSAQPKRSGADEALALQVLSAFQLSSFDEYVLLYPSLQSFNMLIDKSSSIYGSHLAEAKQEFENEYTYTLIPAVRKSFENIIQQGKQQGIEWSGTTFVKLESKTVHEDSGTLMIIFTSGAKTYQLEIQRAMIINGEWKVSQFIKLV